VAGTSGGVKTTIELMNGKIMGFKNSNKQWVFEAFMYITRVCIGCMFIYSSLPKIRQPYDFLSSLYSYELAGPKLGMLIAMTLPWLELLVGICLVGGIFIGGSLLVSMAMAAMFTYVLGSALLNDLDITCGCFGAGATDIVNYSTLIRAIIMLIASFLAYICVILLPPQRKESLAS
jgi:uncharacterized membrane protein YphA (DoxX/SURF4 family)